jgi:DNA repair protein RadC
MTDLAPGDRPREKLDRVGVDALGDNELLAIVLGHGKAGASALVTANRLLQLSGGVQGLTRLTRRQMVKVPGVGLVLAGRVQAAVGLGRRTLAVTVAERQRFGKPREAALFLLPRFGAYPVERFGVMLLDTKLRLIRVELVSVGSIDASLANPRDVFREAVTVGAAAVIVFHNHPSGDPTPSVDDVRLTRRLVGAGEVLGIEVMDHIILADGRYFSMGEAKTLQWRG